MMRNKRKPFFSSYPNKKKSNHSLVPGLKGFLCTCNGNERQCVRESYNILNEYADKLYGVEEVYKKSVEPNNTGNDDCDIADEFKNEVQAIKAKEEDTSRRFKVVDSSVFNCVFIKTTVETPVELVTTILKDLQTTKQRKCRFLIRIIPIEATCKIYMDDIKKAAAEIFDKYFTSEPTTFSIVFTRRYNTSLERDEIIKELADMVSARNADHKVDLTHPQLTILVEILKTVCCLAVVPDYNGLCKYNLHSITAVSTDESKVENTTEIQQGVESKILETDSVVENEADSVPSVPQTSDLIESQSILQNTSED